MVTFINKKYLDADYGIKIDKRFVGIRLSLIESIIPDYYK